MTAVTLTTIVLNDAEVPSDVLVLSRMTKYRRTAERNGRAARVAGGGVRAVVSVGQQQTWTVAISKADAATTDWIEAHVGRVLCIRDDAGRKLFGFYLQAAFEEVPRPRTGSVDLELTEVSWTEAL